MPAAEPSRPRVRRRSRRSQLLVAALTLLVTTPAYATDDDPPGPPAIALLPTSPDPPRVPPVPTTALRWKAEWPRFRTSEYVTTAVVGLSAGALHMFGKPTSTDPIVGPILFDKAVREIRVKSRGELEDVRLVGDVLTIAPMVNTFLVDSLIAPLARRSPDVAWQMTMINIQSFAFSGLVTWTLFEVVGRARPSYRECEAKTSDDPLCRSGVTASFPSGHTASAFTAAGLTCAHHANIPLYGGGFADGLACVASLTVATGAGVLRLVGDRHYATDILAGAGIGLLIGYGLPTLLHYRVPKWDLPAVGSASSPARVGFTPGAGATPLGASAFGIF